GACACPGSARYARSAVALRVSIAMARPPRSIRGGPSRLSISRALVTRCPRGAPARRNGFRTLTDKHDARTGGNRGAVAVREEDKMSRRVFASIAAVVSVVNGIPGLIAPAAVASFYGVTLDSQSILAA